MHRTVFYSWQSDVPGSLNRSFIQRGLQDAIKAIGRDDEEVLEPVMDRDTAGLQGSPDIADSIFAKIAMADLFVADVTIVGKTENGRSVTNPNVLVELGYAASELGWEKIVLVVNTAYGNPAALPFDLRGRRVLNYHLPEGSSDEDKRICRKGLESAFKAALSTQLADLAPYQGPSSPVWWGTWKGRQSRTGFSTLVISEVGPEGFLFRITTLNGSHMGDVTAYARLVGRNLAYARIDSMGDDFGEIRLKRLFDGDRIIMEVTETRSCLNYRGMRANFGGKYELDAESLTASGAVTELQLVRLYNVVGSFMELFRDRLVGQHVERIFNPVASTAISGGVAGLYTIMEAIVVYGDSGELWAAALDDGTVRYFTNQPRWRDKLPAPIEKWRAGFSDNPVEYLGNVGACFDLGHSPFVGPETTNE
ncbi:hypothetical protein ACN9MB_07035 [Dyella kyungheensis]|uniref:hypothetical protein n=1 Tax=Dyella kyungheensis TaxID=1242174 RepID=UPI003CF920CB